MIRTSKESLVSKKFYALLLCLVLALGCVGVGCVGCASTTDSADSAAQSADGQAASESTDGSGEADSSIEQQLLAIDGVTSVEAYTNDTLKENGLDEAYANSIYEITFEQPIDHNNPDAGTFEQHVRLFYSGADAVNIVNTDGYNLTDFPSTAYRKFYNDTFFDHYGTPNIIQIEYRYFGESVPEGLDYDGTDLWEYLTMEQAATDFHEIVQKISTVLTGSRLWTGTSKGGLTTDYQCYFNEQQGYDDADGYIAFCAPFCDSASDDRFMGAVYSDIGYEAYGEEQASEWHDLMDQFQLACIKYRDQLQTKYYQQGIDEGNTFCDSYFGTDDTTRAERLWDLTVNEFPAGFWQYYQAEKVDEIKKAVEDDDPDEIYACVVDLLPTDSNARTATMETYAIQTACEMGNYTEDFDHLRQLVAEAKEAAPDEEKDAYYLVTEGNPSYAAVFLNEDQLETFVYDSSTRDAMIEWLNSTTEARLVMVSGKSDTWYSVRPGLTFENSQIQQFESTYNHRTAITDLSEEDQAAVWEILDGWIG